MKRIPFVAALTALIAVPAHAQQAPDAGQVLQQNLPATRSPGSQPSGAPLDLPDADLPDTGAGGAQVTLQRIELSGNSVFSSAQILDQVGAYRNQTFDLAGLQAIANRITRFYRTKGYAFARALIPAQDVADGTLRITILEGRYGSARATGSDDLADAIQEWLDPLAPGSTIEAGALERRLLLIGDLPGIAIAPVIRPGEATGTGALDVKVTPTQRVRRFVGADNYGSRFSGSYRARAGIIADRLAVLGDELAVTALVSEESTWLTDARYEIPIGVSGLRGSLAYSHTDYELGAGFEGYNGIADVYSTALEYPLIRRADYNLTINGGFRLAKLEDSIDFANFESDTDSRTFPVGSTFDITDTFLGGGVTYGAVVLTPGRIEVMPSGFDNRSYTFFKSEFDITRLQSLPVGFQLSTRVNAQVADRDQLDGLQRFFLGGPYGVRAYPVGEGSGSRGVLGQVELRYPWRYGLAPYSFYDIGTSPNGGVDSNTSRTVGGAGLGLRFVNAGFNVDVAGAWQTNGGDPQADDADRDPRLLANVGYQF